MSRAAKHQRLSVVGAVQDLPTVFRGVRWIDSHRQALILLVPSTGHVILAVVTMRGPDAGKATVYESGDSWPTSSKEFAALGRPMTVDKAVARVRRTAELVDAGRNAAVELRGRWTGTWSLSKSLVPMVVLRRRVGHGVITVRTSPDGGWLVQAEVDPTWKGKASKSESTHRSRLGQAMVKGAALIRAELGKLHGESDRRQAHDATYAAKKPIKRGREGRDPLNRVKPLLAYTRKSKSGSGSSSKTGRVVVRVERSSGKAGMKWLEVREQDGGLYRVSSDSHTAPRSTGLASALLSLNTTLHGHAGEGVRYVAKSVKVPGVMLPVMRVDSKPGVDRRKSGAFVVCRELVPGETDRYWSEGYRMVGAGETVELPRRKMNEAIAKALASELLAGIALDTVKLGGKTAQARLSEARSLADAKRTPPKPTPPRSRARSKPTSPRKSRGQDALSTSEKDAQLRQLFMSGIRQAMRG